MAKTKQLWSDIDGEPWLDNPRRKRRRKAKGARRRGKRRASAVMNPPRRRKRSRGRFRANPVRRGRRRGGFRRNPVSVRGIMGRAMDGMKGGLAVLAGDAAASAVPKLIPVAAIQSGIGAAVAEALTALFTAPLVARMVGPRWAQVYLYGGFSRPLRGLVVGLNLPIVSPALAAYPGSTLNALPAGRSLAASYDATTLESEEAFVM